jgi:hypothetical protein
VDKTQRSEMQRALLTDMVAVFGLAATDSPADHVSVCNVVLRSLASCIDVRDSLDPETVRHLLLVHVKAVWNLLNPENANPAVVVVEALKGPIVDVRMSPHPFRVTSLTFLCRLCSPRGFALAVRTRRCGTI